MSVLEQVRCYAQVSKSCCSSEQNDVNKLTEALKTYLWNEALNPIEEHINGVLVVEYSADSTP
eukprot:2548915-Amphidinium_carterae.1